MSDPTERRTRDQTLRAVFADPKSRHHEAIAEAELNIDYGASPIVMGDAHRALAPGQRLPDTIEVRLANGKGCGLHELAHRAGHTALLFGGAATRHDELLRRAGALRAQGNAAFIDETIAITTEATNRHGVAMLAPAAAECLGIGDLTLLVVRPDGHVGLRADRNHRDALAAYQSLLASGNAR